LFKKKVDETINYIWTEWEELDDASKIDLEIANREERVKVYFIFILRKFSASVTL
jgi:hypothetical protein